MLEIEKDLEDLKLIFNQRFEEIRNKYCEGEKWKIMFKVSNTFFDEPKFEFFIDVSCIKPKDA